MRKAQFRLLFKAQERRITETGSCGVTLEQIRKHLVDNIPGLKISLKSVHLLLRAPRKGTHAADGCKRGVDARPGVKDNSNRKSHPDQHHCASQVKTAREFGSDHKSQCVTLSCDDKSKIMMGLPAVSRYHQLRKFFVQIDSPQCNDHDFPVPRYLISPYGYMVIESGNTGTTVGGNGREHVVYAHTGPVTLFNRACVFHSSIKVPCGDCRSVHIGGQEYKLQYYNDYETVKRYFKVGLSTVYSVLPRPFLQGATPCPFLVTPCLF